MKKNQTTRKTTGTKKNVRVVSVQKKRSKGNCEVNVISQVHNENSWLYVVVLAIVAIVGIAVVIL